VAAHVAAHASRQPEWSAPEIPEEIVEEIASWRRSEEIVEEIASWRRSILEE
jgi:hypothetical protein